MSRNEIKNIFKENNLFQCNTAIFCGAGISLNSGIPLALKTVKEIINCLSRNQKEADELFKCYKSRKVPFEEFMQIILQNLNSDKIFEIYKIGYPNYNHIIIGHLAKCKLLKYIFTTNFDLNIELAFQSFGLIENKDYCVIRNIKDFNNLNFKLFFKDSKIHLFKLHGSVDQKQSIRTTLSNIANNKMKKSIENSLKFLLNSPEIVNALFIGYSFSDIFDIIPIFKSYKEIKVKPIIINHNNRKICKITYQSKFDKNFPFRTSGLILDVFTDEFVKMIAIKTKYNV